MGSTQTPAEERSGQKGLGGGVGAHCKGWQSMRGSLAALGGDGGTSTNPSRCPDGDSGNALELPWCLTVPKLLKEALLASI